MYECVSTCIRNCVIAGIFGSKQKQAFVSTQLMYEHVSMYTYYFDCAICSAQVLCEYSIM